MQPMKLFLIGYMGSGKSTVGKRVAEKLQMDFIDFDKYIEAAVGKTIAEIFDTEGEEKFRLLERDHLAKLIPRDNCLISLGGGTPCFYNNIELINKSSTSVYIDVAVDDLVKRLSNAKHKRPLIRGMNEVDLKYFIEANLEKRLPVYSQAHHTIKVGKKSIDEVAEAIIGMIRS